MIYLLVSFIVLSVYASIVYAYYLDYKANPKAFKKSIISLKSLVLKVIVAVVLIYFSFQVNDFSYLLRNNHGLEYNHKREDLNIPLLTKEWSLDKSKSNFYNIEWWNSDPTQPYFKKVIEFSVLGNKTETDYYKNKDLFYAWSVYDYNKNKSEYFIEVSNPKQFTMSETGFITIEHPKITKNVTKSKFTNFISMY
jgi:hypothetical protein